MSKWMGEILRGGLAGGTAEVAIVTLLALTVGIGGWSVAAGIADASFGAVFAGRDAILVGMAAHFALSFLIAACFLPLAPTLARWGGAAAVLGGAMLALAGVWALNFFLVLPRIAPEFVTIVPLWASFASKLGFGAAMGAVFVRCCWPPRLLNMPHGQAEKLPPQEIDLLRRWIEQGAKP